MTSIRKKESKKNDIITGQRFFHTGTGIYLYIPRNPSSI